MALPDPTNLTRCLRLPGYFPGGIIEQFLRVLPFESVDGYGRSVQINRATTLAGAAMYAADGAIDVTTGLTALTTFNFKRLGGTAEVDSADQDASGPENDLLEIEVSMKKTSLLRSLASQVITGTGAGNNLAGLDTVAIGGQEIGLAGAIPALADYHRLVALVRASDGAIGAWADALVMNRNARRQLISLLEAAAGGGTCYARDEALGVPVLLFEGLPVFVSDSIPLTGVTLDETNIFAVKLTGPTGIRMLHVGGSSEEYGIVVEDVPAQLLVAKRAKTVRGFYCLLVPELESVARISSAEVPIP